MLAYVYVHSGRIRYTIAFHVIINFIGGMVSMMVSRYLFSVRQDADVIAMLKAMAVAGAYLTLLFGVLITGIVLMICMRKRFRLYPGPVRLPEGRRFSVMFLNVGMLAYMALCAAKFILNL